MAANKKTVGYAVQVGGIAAFTLGAILSMHHLAIGAAFESMWIRLADQKGNLFSYPKTDEQYPTLWSQQRAVLLQLLANRDPQLQAVLAHPENMSLVKRLIGLEEFVIPYEESRTKQYREIAQLVAEALIVKRHDESGIEATLPSILPDEFADNHAVELEICMRWFWSDAGPVARIEVPAGYANVRAHALFHRDYMRKQQAAAPLARLRRGKSVSGIVPA